MTITRYRRGFSLIEMLVVVLIIGILAAIAAPRYFKVVEKSRAVEAVHFFATLSESEDHYQVQNGAYWIGSLTAGCPLSICLAGSVTALKSFNPPPPTVAVGGGWALTLTRNLVAVGYGQYSLTYTRIPGVPAVITVTNCTAGPTCLADLGIQ